EGVTALCEKGGGAPPPPPRHVVDRYRARVEPLGARAHTVAFALPADAAAEARVDEFLMGAGLKPRDRLVVLNPGAGRPDKRWPIESFRTLAQRLTDEAGASILVIWGPNELADARAIVGTETPGPAVLAPPTNLDELLA